MAAPLSNLADIDARIAAVRENLRQLVEQAAGFSGAADDELISSRIQEQEAELEALSKRRLALTAASGG
jgi:cell division protein FtsB